MGLGTMKKLRKELKHRVPIAKRKSPLTVRKGQASLFEAFIALVLIAMYAFLARFLNDFLNEFIGNVPAGSQLIVSLFVPAIGLLVLWYIISGKSQILVRGG